MRLRRCVGGLALVGLVGSSCGSEPENCTNLNAVPIASEDAEHNAWVFVRRCESEPIDSVHVSVLPREAALPDAAGNAFSVEGIHGVSIDWKTPQRLVVRHGGGSIVDCRSPEPALEVRCEPEGSPR